VAVDPHKIDLGGLRLSALGGTFAGSAYLQELDQYKLQGSLSHFDIETAMRALGQAPLGYDGIVSGPVQAEGSVKNSSAIVARAGLAIAPGPRGVPVSGGSTWTTTVARTPWCWNRLTWRCAHARRPFRALGQQIQVKLVSSDLRDSSRWRPT